MEFWEVFIAAVAGSVLAAPILAVLSKILIAHWLEKDLAKYQSDLRVENDKALEDIRGAIAAANIEHQIVLSKLHEKRAEAVYILHKRIVECLDKAGPVVYNADGSEPEAKAKIVGEFQESFRSMVVTLRESQLYLSKETCAFIDASLKEVLNPMSSYMFWMNIRKGTDRDFDKYNEKWEQAVKAIEERAPEVVGKLEEEFRSMLGVR